MILNARLYSCSKVARSSRPLSEICFQRQYVGQLKGDLPGLDEDQSEPEVEDESEDESEGFVSLFEDYIGRMSMRENSKLFFLISEFFCFSLVYRMRYAKISLTPGFTGRTFLRFLNIMKFLF